MKGETMGTEGKAPGDVKKQAEVEEQGTRMRRAEWTRTRAAKSWARSLSQAGSP